MNIEQCIEAEKLFNKIDTNNNDKINKEELINGIENYWNLSREEIINKIEEIFDNIDNNHNGYNEYEEFVRVAIDPSIFMSQNYLKYAFRYFDHNNSGNISLEEI